MRIISAGGSTAPLDVSSSALQLISIDYDVKQTAFLVRIRFDNTISNTIDVLYVSHIESSNMPGSLATFDADVFPCLATGTAPTQQQRENSVCCLDRLHWEYSTVSAFDRYLGAGLEGGIRTEIARQGARLELDSAPRNDTKDLLDASLDFVSGDFSRMSRSYASLDPTPTRGYKDVNIYLALEDVELFVATRDDLQNGHRLRFFIGMAHIKPTSSDRDPA